MNIGDKILNYRKSKGYSQEDIANKLNVSRQTVSKWETNQSTPDFDKIVPLCQLFGISTDEFLLDKNSNVKEVKNEVIVQDNNDEKGKRKFAINLCVSIFLYFVSVMWIIFADAVGIDEEIYVVVFLGIIALATVIIVYASLMRKGIKEKHEKVEDNNPIVKTVNGILALIFTAIYLIISFATMAWHVTWILWIIYGIVVDIVKLIFQLEDKDE